MDTQSQSSRQGKTSAPHGIGIALLALDLTGCNRCLRTLANIETAIDTIRPVLEVTGAEVRMKKIVIKSEEQAHQHQFVTSPTVRINGRDIAFETLESECEACTDLCGCEERTSCRVWRYQGQEYTEAPVGLVVEALLREIFGNGWEPVGDTPAYDGVPENLRRFFEGPSAKRPAGTESCCPPAEQQTCCELGEKTACCDTSEPTTCGCT